MRKNNIKMNVGRYLKHNKNIVLITAIIVLLLIGVIIIAVNKTKNNNSLQVSHGIFSNLNIEQKLKNKKVNDNVIIIEMEGKEINEDTEEIKKLEKEDTTNTPTYYIKVNNTANTVTIYKKDGNGNYTIPVKAMVCSVGSSTPSSGQYKIPGRRSRWRALYGDVYGQYVTNIVGAILFHSVPYLDTDPSTLEYWEYDKLGTSASMGCVRLTVVDAKWIYENVEAGTIVEFYSESNPGPLGKPSSQKISGNVQCRNWDPTDYSEGNPWRNPQSTQQQETQEQQQEAIPTPEPTVVPTQTPISTPTPTIEPTPTKVPTPTTTATPTQIIDDTQE